MKFSWKYSNGIAYSENVESDLEDCSNKDVKPTNNNLLKMKKPKRIRSAFTTNQINYLEKEFKRSPYIATSHRKEIATILKISDRSVKVWFQNRRMKEKRDSNNKDNDDEILCISPIDDTKKELNNIDNQQSVNEQKLRSLPIFTNKDAGDTDVQVIENAKSNLSNIIRSPYFSFNKDTIDKQNQLLLKFENKHIQNTVMKRSVNDLKTTAELSIGNCKKHKMSSDYLIREEETAKNPKIDINKKQNINCNRYTKMPDLTSYERRVVPPRLPKQQEATRTIPNPEYIPFVPNFYPQTYMPPGGVIWNPINVMPLVQYSSNNSSARAQDNMVPRADCACNCNCHMKTKSVPMAFQQNHHGPQFVFTALPLQNPSASF